MFFFRALRIALDHWWHRKERPPLNPNQRALLGMFLSIPIMAVLWVLFLPITIPLMLFEKAKAWWNGDRRPPA